MRHLLAKTEMTRFSAAGSEMTPEAITKVNGLFCFINAIIQPHCDPYLKNMFLFEYGKLQHRFIELLVLLT